MFLSALRWYLSFRVQLIWQTLPSLTTSETWYPQTALMTTHTTSVSSPPLIILGQHMFLSWMKMVWQSPPPAPSTNCRRSVYPLLLHRSLQWDHINPPACCVLCFLDLVEPFILHEQASSSTTNCRISVAERTRWNQVKQWIVNVAFKSRR